MRRRAWNHASHTSPRRQAQVMLPMIRGNGGIDPAGRRGEALEMKTAISLSGDGVDRKKPLGVLQKAAWSMNPCFRLESGLYG